MSLRPFSHTRLLPLQRAKLEDAQPMTLALLSSLPHPSASRQTAMVGRIEGRMRRAEVIWGDAARPGDAWCRTVSSRPSGPLHCGVQGCKAEGQERFLHLTSHLCPFPQQNGWLLMSPTTRAVWKVLLSPIPSSGAAPALPDPGFALLHGLSPESWA